jgi:hypothetical protein
MTTLPLQSNHKSRRGWDIAVTFLVFAGIVVVVSRTVADPDLWGHLKFGLDTLANGAVMKADPYSYLTAGQPWINHEWLAELSFALTWLAVGSAGLVLLKVLFWGLTYAIPYAYLVRTGLPPLRAGILVLLSLPLTAPLFGTVRPHFYTALLFMLVLWMMVQAEQGRYRWLWLGLVLFALWPNLHGAFPAGLGVLGVWGGLHLLLHRNRHAWLSVIPPLLLSAVAILANPWGLEMHRFILEHLEDARLEITEWRPLDVSSLLGTAYLVWIGLILLGFVYSRRPKAIPLLVPLAITAYLPLRSERMMLFFGLAAILLAGEHIGDAWLRFMPAKASAKTSRWAVALVVVAGLILLGWKASNFSGIPGASLADYPVNAMRLLNQSGVQGNLAVHFNWGDYVIWHMPPGVKVSIDTRREMAYSLPVYRMNVRYMSGIGRWDELLEEYPTDMALVVRHSPTDNLMAQRLDWSLVYQDETASLYVRRDSSQYHRLLSAARSFEAATEPQEIP